MPDSCKRVKTVEEAKKLPEVDHEILQRVTYTRDDGITVETDVIRPFTPQSVDGNDIFSFVDSDGRLMKVVSTENGPAKTEF